MLTKEEKDFLNYWEANRGKNKKFLRQFSIGLPIGVLLVAAVFINLLSGWYKKADMIIRSNSSILITILIALVGIAIFFTIFSSRFKWEQNEQRYLDLKAKEQKEKSLQ
jgi:ATP/ADP translocase